MVGLRLAVVAALVGALGACACDDDPGRGPAGGPGSGAPAATGSTAGGPGGSGNGQDGNGNGPGGTGNGNGPGGNGNGNGASTSPGGGSTGAPRTAPTNGDTTRPGGPRTTSTPGGSRVIKWIKSLGITGGGTPEGDVSAYASLAEGACAEVFDIAAGSMSPGSTVLYEGTAHACLAAFEGQTAGWARAEEAYLQLRSRGDEFDCIGAATLVTLVALVEAHRQEPAARFERGGQGTAGDPHCPRVLSIAPGHGPLEGGYQLRFTGVNRPAEATIEFGLSTRPARTDGTSGVVTVPPGAEPGGTYVSVLGWPWGPFGSPTFTYDPP